VPVLPGRGDVVTCPSRDVVRHHHEHEGWWLVADTVDVDVWTIVEDTGWYSVKSLDVEGIRELNWAYVEPHDVVATVARFLDGRWYPQ
jgi:hypothetical protein